MRPAIALAALAAALALAAPARAQEQGPNSAKCRSQLQHALDHWYEPHIDGTEEQYIRRQLNNLFSCMTPEQEERAIEQAVDQANLGGAFSSALLRACRRLGFSGPRERECASDIIDELAEAGFRAGNLRGAGGE